MSTNDSLPDDVETLKAMLVAAQAACLEAQAKARNLEAEARTRALLIEQMKFTIAKLRHERFGQSSERGAVLVRLEFVPFRINLSESRAVKLSLAFGGHLRPQLGAAG